MTSVGTDWADLCAVVLLHGRRLVQIVMCTDSPQTDTLKLYCWDDPTPRTACYNDNPSACMFSYSWSVTPEVKSVSPTVGASGDVLTLQGNALEDVTELLLAATWGSISCPVVDKHSTNMSCIVPDMPAGLYGVSVASFGFVSTVVLCMVEPTV